MKNLVILWILFVTSQGLDKNRTLQLRHMLLDNYSRAVQPTSGSQKLILKLRLLPLSIVELDQTKQTFTVLAHVFVTWLDRELAWNGSEFSDVNTLSLELDEIWWPKYQITNSVDRVTGQTLYSSILLIKNGQVIYGSTDVFKTICTVDLTRYPFDTQDCAIIFSSSSLDYDYSDLNSSLLDTRHDSFTKTADLSGIPMVEFHFKLRRHSVYYVLTIILPVSLLSILDAFVFLLPVESGEKMSFLISIMLSFAVYLNFINDVMPKSKRVSKLAAYLVLALAQSAISIIITICTLDVNYRGNRSSFTDKNKIVPTRSSADDSKKEEKTTAEFCGKHFEETTQNVARAPLARKLNLILFSVFLMSALLSPLLFLV